MIFLVWFAGLYAAHYVGDHWVQTHTQATTKGATGWIGRRACLEHVIWLTVLKMTFVGFAELAAGVRTPMWAGFLVLALDAASHYWADRAAYHPTKEGRRVTLEALAHRMGKTEFWNLGKGVVGPDGKPAANLGTGAYALDQSWHVLWIFISALLISVLAGI